ncbi:MAG: RagB/SusD family nutrient uptake outer membrane protein [Bacteroidaceae bacterium]|nr:RagB/SusD family nutrient uptake outer membrane protein [Bacteroidaceae bacterium]
MKKYIFSALIICLGLASCNTDELDIAQKGVTPINQFYQTDADAEAALVAAYQGFNWNVTGWNGTSTYNALHFCFNLCGDDVLSAGAVPFDNDFAGAVNEFRYDNSNAVVSNAYLNFVYSIFYDNLIIDNFANPQTKVKKRVVAEARVLRAYQMMMLAIGWGCPPVLDHLFGAEEHPYNCDADENGEKKMSHEQLLEWCAKECEDACADLDIRKDVNDKEGAYRVTQGFALSVAGKAHMFAKNYKDAHEDFAKVIGSGRYELVDGDKFWQNFHVEGDGNSEKIFETNIANVQGDAWGTTLIQRTTWMETNIWGWRGDHFVLNPGAKYISIDGWGGGGVPKAFADEFVANDGEESHRLQASIININDVIAAEPSRVWGKTWGYGNDSIDNLTKDQKIVSKSLGLTKDGLYGQSFYLHLKFIPCASDLRNPGENLLMKNFTIMRYAEVLLLDAEALIQLNKPTEALEIINKIQRRAGSKTISTEATMAVLEKEKKFELWLEDCRWADMVRWNHFDGVLTKGNDVPWLYDKYTRARQTGDENVQWENGTEENSRYYTVSSHAARDRGDIVGYEHLKATNGLFPYPFDAMAKNPNIRQNAGW